MTKKVNISAGNHQPAMHYYKLNPACERGKAFTNVVGKGANMENEANQLARKYKAVASIPVGYADFGGIVAFAFGKTAKPDLEMFLSMNHVTEDGYCIFEPNVQLERKVYLWEEMPAEAPDIIRFSRELTAVQALRMFPRKMVATAMKMELKYLHPMEALRNLNVNKEELAEYFMGKKTIQEVLAGKMFVSKRDKQMMRFAIEGDKEHRAFMKEAEKRRFGMCDIIHGAGSAIKLYREMMALPVIPMGTLNGIVGLKQANSRCGFFFHQNWIWIKSSAESTLEVSDDWQVVNEEDWNEACKAEKALHTRNKKRKEKKDAATKDEDA